MLTVGDVTLIYILGIVAGIIYAGYENDDDLAFISLFWPFVLPLFLLFGAVLFLFNLGKSARPKEEPRHE